jgi:hypothetical protein
LLTVITGLLSQQWQYPDMQCPHKVIPGGRGRGDVEKDEEADWKGNEKKQQKNWVHSSQPHSQLVAVPTIWSMIFNDTLATIRSRH